MYINDAYQLFSIVKSTEKIKGDIAEIGVYKGGSAKIICEAKGNKKLHLFDTFEGLPEVDINKDEKYLHKGDFKGSVEEVQDTLKDYENVFIYKGLFSKTSEQIKDKRFSLVNIDVDLYKSVLDCLDFFYPRMNKGGIILSHDYRLKGGKMAIDKFFLDKPEPIIEADLQCLVVKI